MQSILYAHRSGGGVAFSVAAILLLALTERAAQADTTGQAQQVCSQAAASYERMDLTGSMRMYDPACHMSSVSGSASNYRQILTGIVEAFTPSDKTRLARIVVRAVRLQSGLAYAILDRDHRASRQGYTKTRKIVEETV